MPAILNNPPFRRRVLELVTDLMVTTWWSDYFDRRLLTEIINPASWIHTGAIVIVNTAKGTVGADAAAVVGGALMNLVGPRDE